MKKTILLLTILCAGHLYGMEPEQGYTNTNLNELSPEVRYMIVRALSTTYNPKLNNIENLKNTVNALNAMSRVNKQFNAIINDLYGKSQENLKEFTKLVHILADNFNVSTKEVAMMFNTPIAQQYIDLGEQLVILVYGDKLDPRRQMEIYNKTGKLPTNVDPQDIITLIKNGADVNYISKLDPKIDYKESPLSAAVFVENVALVNLLLEHGANPELVAHILDPFTFITYSEKIKETIEKALKK